MSTPLDTVDVVIATHNRPELLREALDAVLTQDYSGRIECIVVFDQTAPDTTLAFDDGRRAIRVMTNTRTPGLAGARNTGVTAATGEWVAFCDDDDIWDATKLSKQLTLLAGCPGVDVVTAGITVKYEQHETVRIPQPEELTKPRLLRSRVTAAHPSTIVVRREAFLDRIGVVDEGLPGSYAEDYEWLLRAVDNGPIAVVPEPLVTVLWGRTSFFADRWSTILAAIRYLLDKHPEFQTEPLGLARLYGRMAFAHAALGERAEARRYARKTLSLNWRERRAYVALAVSTGLIPAGQVLRIAHATGRGI